MKKIITILLMLLALNSIAQKINYIQLGATGYLKSGGSLVGLAVEAGQVNANSGFGIGVDALTQKGNGLFVPIYLHGRYYLGNKPNSQFLLLQSGYTIRNRNEFNDIEDTRLNSKGGLYLAAGAGFVINKSNPNLALQVKYSMLSTKTTIYKSDKLRSTTREMPGFISVFFGVAF